MVSKRSTAGFTLIELLVVIAIIAILAAVLLPVYVSAKERAHQCRCLAHLRQLAQAIIRYSSDYGGKPPNPGASDPTLNWYGGTWGGYIYPEKGQIWLYVRTRDMYLCPSDRRTPAEDVMALALQRGQPDIYEWAKNDYPLSYSMNSSLGRKMIDAIARTKQVMLLIHEGRKTINDGSFKVVDPKSGRWFDVPSKVHYDGTTIAYLDTHAAWRSYKQLIAERGYWYVGN
ncbi:MAG: prepilin-type N-terminal cleavage/methylation domain-containing protein [Armatimonadota bacterium]